MGLIALEGMRFYAYHGFYDEEQITGNNYIVDVHIQTNFKAAAKTDDLYKTINYETVFLICQAVMRKKTKLLETLVEEIIDALKHQFDNIQEVKVRISKENPMGGNKVDRSVVENAGKFVSKCPRCSKPLICYKDGNCWCMDKRLYPKTQEMLKQQYRGCLCKECLTYFSGIQG